MKWLLACVVFVVGLSPAYAFDPVGLYLYKEKGYAGEMVVTETSSFPVTWNAKITTASNDGFTCEVEANGNNLMGSASEIEATFASVPQEDMPQTKFMVKFKPKGAAIEIEDIGGACGIRGSFSGNWVRKGAEKGPSKTKADIIDDSPSAVVTYEGSAGPSKAWFKFKYKAKGIQSLPLSPKMKKQAGYAKILYSAGCEDGTIQPLNSVLYSKTGAVLVSGGRESSEPVIPGTTGEKIKEKICGGV